MFCPLSHMCISLTFQHLICFTVSLLGSFIGLSPGISSGLLSSCPLTLVLLSLSHLPWFVRCLSPYVPCHVLLFSSVKLTKVSRSVVSPYISFPFLFLVRHLFSSLVSVKVACLSLRLIVSLVCYFYSPLSNTCYVQFNFSCPLPCNQCFLFPCYSVCLYIISISLYCIVPHTYMLCGSGSEGFFSVSEVLHCGFQIWLLAQHVHDKGVIQLYKTPLTQEKKPRLLL